MVKTVGLSIIIVNFNTSALTLGCVKSVKKYLRNIEYEIIVVNNSSRDDERTILQKALKESNELKVINTENRGFGTANNLGSESARGKYLLFLNSDTLLIDDSIEKMLKFLKNRPEIGALSPLLFQSNKTTLQKRFFGDFPNFLSITFGRWQDRTVDLSKKYFYAEMVSGACMMIEREKFMIVDRFDQNFFMYCEDDDLCRRLTKFGFKNAVLTCAKIIHLEGKSQNSKNRLKMYYKSQSYYWQKHNGALARILMEIIRFPYMVFNLLLSK